MSSLYQKQSVTQAPKAGSLSFAKVKEVAGAVQQPYSSTGKRHKTKTELDAENKAKRDSINAGRDGYMHTTEKLSAPENVQPDSISGVVDDTIKTYREQAESINKGSYLEYAETYENIMGKSAPFSTQEEYLAWRATQNQQDLDYLEQQSGYSREIEKMQFDQAREGIAGAKSGVQGSMAQGREGAMSGTAPMFTSEFSEQMSRQVQQLEVQKASAERSREKQMIDLKRAQESGDMDMVQAIEGRIASIEQDLRQTDSQLLQTATLAEQQALESAKFQHSASMDVQANYRANLSVYQDMVQSGNQMTVQQISQFAESLGVPFEVASGYYESAQMIRDDKAMDFQGKQIALTDLARDFELKVQGVIGEKAQITYGVMQMVKEGRMTQDEATQYLMAAGVDSNMNPLTQLAMQAQSLDNLGKQIGLKYLDEEKRLAIEGSKKTLTSMDYENMILGAKAANASEMEIAQLEQMKAQARMLELQTNEYEQSFDVKLSDGEYKDIFFQKGTNRSARSKAGGDNIRECGEGFNDITDGGKVGNGFNSGKGNKMSFVTHRDNPQIGNGVVTSHGGKKYGHMETVIGKNEVTGKIVLGGWNYYNDGKWSTREMSVEDLNSKYGKDWGFTDSKLKDQYASKLESSKVPDSRVGEVAQNFINTGVSREKALSMAEDIVTKEMEGMYSPESRKKYETIISVSDTVVRDFQRSIDMIKANPIYAIGGAQGRIARLADKTVMGDVWAIQQMLDSAKSNVGIDTLLKIKESGAGLGAIPQAQLETLMSVLGKFDAVRDPADLIADLESARDSYQSAVNGARENLQKMDSMGSGGGGGSVFNPPETKNDWMTSLLGDFVNSNNAYAPIDDIERMGYSNDFF